MHVSPHGQVLTTLQRFTQKTLCLYCSKNQGCGEIRCLVYSLIPLTFTWKRMFHFGNNRSLIKRHGNLTVYSVVSILPHCKSPPWEVPILGLGEGVLSGPPIHSPKSSMRSPNLRGQGGLQTQTQPTPPATSTLRYNTDFWQEVSPTSS